MALNVLFPCSRNRLRSPTAEQVFAGWPGVETAPAGLGRDADNPRVPEQFDRADLVFAMEPAHRRERPAKFGARPRGKRVVRLGIPDDCDFMATERGQRPKACVPRHLPPV